MSTVDTRPVAAEPSFNEGLSLTVDRALRHLDLPAGLPEQIKACAELLAPVAAPARLAEVGDLLVSSATGAEFLARMQTDS